MNKATYTVFQNDKVMVKYINDYYSIVALDDLDVGTFVVLEHVISKSEMHDIIFCIMKDQDLFNTLYPRDFNINELNNIFLKVKTQDKNADYDIFIDSFKSQMKLKDNVFMFNQKHVLCNFISKFNHSCIPNCHMDSADNIDDNMFYGIWTHRKIKKNEELTIDYCQSGNINHHNEMKKIIKWTCNCSDKYIEANKKRAKVHMNLGVSFVKRDNNTIHNLVDNYIKSDLGKLVKLSQSLQSENIKYNLN